MSEVKNAGQGAVTSIADNDLVMCVANGSYHPISFENLMAAVRDGIQVGGRNYLRSTFSAPSAGHTDVVDGKLAITGAGDVYFYVLAATDLTHLIGETLTLSFTCEGLPNGAILMFGIGGSGINVVTLQNGRCSVTFVGTAVTCPAKNGHILIDDQNNSMSASDRANIRLSNFKLEIGNIATDWTPAPEDIASGAWGGGNWLFTNYLQFGMERRCA